MDSWTLPGSATQVLQYLYLCKALHIWSMAEDKFLHFMPLWPILNGANKDQEKCETQQMTAFSSVCF